MRTGSSRCVGKWPLHILLLNRYATQMNWGYDDALTTADRHVFFKARTSCFHHPIVSDILTLAAVVSWQIMLRSVAEQHGYRVTFMPKPYLNRTGSGAHVHVSGWGAPGTPQAGKNLFHDAAGDLGLSSLAYEFIAGVLGSAEGLCALTNPTVNSYKRLNATVTRSGATWSPNTVTYTGNNRTHMIRIPDINRFEFRLPVRFVAPPVRGELL